MNERRVDLNCREDCPFTSGRTSKKLRPCVTNIQSNVEFCLKQIDNHFSKHGIKNPTYNTVPEILPKRIEIFNDRREIAIIANGVVVFVKPRF